MNTNAHAQEISLTPADQWHAMKPFQAFGRFEKILSSMLFILEHLAALALAIDVAVVFASVVCRYFLHSPVNWAEEVASALMVTMIFLGGATVLARSKHSGLDAFRQLFPYRWRGVLIQFCSWLIVAVAVGLLVSSIQFLIISMDQTTPFGLPQWIFIFPPVVGSFFMAIFGLAQALSGPKRTVWWTFVFAVCLAAAVVTWNALIPEYKLTPPILIGISFIIPLMIGLPIAFALALCSLVYFMMSPLLPLSIYAQQMIAGSSHFVLLAIPFFVLAGIAMEVNGMSIRLIELLLRLVGRMRGGLNVIIVVASFIFSGISGSKNADIAAVGAVIMPAVRKANQDPNEAAGLLASTAIMSETIPPCINMIVYGFVANVSIGGMFIAGLIPAAVLAVILLAVTIYFGKRVNPDEVFTVRRRLLPLIGGALVGFLMIFMIGRGVMIGVATSTEISAFAVVYALVVGGLAFRELTIKSTIKLFVDSAGMAGAILFIVAAASSLSFSLSIEQIPQNISISLVKFGTHYGSTMFLVLAAMMMIFFGSILEGAPALIIFAPLLAPVALQMGIDPIHFGIISVVALGFGICSPPLGICLYTTCVVTGTNIRNVSLPMMKYLIVLFIGLLLLVFVPEFSLWLPRRWGL